MNKNRMRARLLLPALPLMLISLNNVSAQVNAIAVLDFDGIGIAENEAVALSNRLRNEIFKTGSQMVDRGMMQNILAEQDFQLSGCTSNDCLVEVGQLLGATRMVGGSISKVGNTYTVSARLVDVGTGEVLAVSDFDLRGELDDMLTTGMKQVAVRLLRQGDPPASPQLTATPPPITIPPSGGGAWVATAGLPLGEGGMAIDITRFAGTRWLVGGIMLQPYFNFTYAFRTYLSSDENEYYEDNRGGIGGGMAIASSGTLPIRAYFGVAYGVGEYYEEYFGSISSDTAGDIFTNLGGQIRLSQIGGIGLLADMRIVVTSIYGSSFLLNLGLER